MNVPVIGIGASAGGLEALREVFGGLQGPTGMAFVVVQHLDPTHESQMAQLIERYTTMEVRQAEGGEKMEANHVYVIPPGHGLALRGGILNLTEFSDPRGMRRPIDDFFESLADDQGRMAACVILSGTGGDGSRGLRAIKEHGGLCVAQEPGTAAYDGMPDAAINTGLVDFICDPSNILAELRTFFDRNPDGTEFKEEAAEVTDHIDEMCEILEEAVGHDFGNYKRATLTRRIARRMQVVGLDTADEYLGLIRKNSDECEALFRDLLINVTKFFRDKDQFETLDREVIHKLVKDSRNAQEIRVWVAGCSSGEEPYTLAMYFAEAMRKFDRRPYVQIFATDIDDKMLDIARDGTYPLSALEDIPSPYRERYTIGGTDHFRMVPQIREMVRFSAHNLVRDPPYSKLDLVSCRNLLIYFDDTLQKQVLPLFHYALSPGGFLFLGSSEAIGRSDDLFLTINQSARLFKRKNVHSRVPLKFSGGNRGQKARRTLRDEPPPTRADEASVTALKRVAETYAPISLLVDAEGILLDKFGSAGRYLEFPDRMERNLHVPTLARPGLREVVGPLIRKVADSGNRSVTRDVRITTEFGLITASVLCEPVADGAYLLVVRETKPLEVFDGDDLDEFDAGDGQLQFLEEELQLTRHRLRSTVEELETTNEELKSSNEEMMSMNEELQSTNEELTTVNDELKSKVDQISVANADLRNFFDTTSIIVLVVDSNLCLRSFTDAAKTLFPLTESHRGRALAELPTELADAEFVQRAARAARDGTDSEYRATTGDESREFIARTIPYRRSDGKIDGATIVFTDVTESLSMERDLREERARLRLALDVAKIGIWEYEPSSDLTVLDDTERELLEISEDDEAHEMGPILSKLTPADRDAVNNALRRAMDGDKDFDEVFRLPLKDGSIRVLHGLGRRVMSGGDKKFIGVTYDVTDEYEVLEERELMIREMNHRVKNLFAVIAAMVSICRRDFENVDDFAESLRDRIYALGKSHSLTSGGGSGGAPLRELVATVIAPTRDGQDITFEGPDIEIPNAQLTSVALILHEWATNAAKYGGLSVENGAVAVRWSLDDRTVTINWRETGGGEKAGDGSGFGTQLITATTRQLQGSVEGKMGVDGYRRSLTFALA